MIPVFEAAELDALTEACNIGMGHAATALSQLMGKGVNIEAPRLQVLDRPGASGLLDTEQVRALRLHILGNIRGSILILLKESNARRIVELLLGSHKSSELPLDELEISTLMEVGNIIASACLNALGLLLKMTLLPSVPTLISGEAGKVLTEVLEGPNHHDSLLMIDTVFSIGEAPCCGSVFLVPAPESLEAMVAALAGK